MSKNIQIGAKVKINDPVYITGIVTGISTIAGYFFVKADHNGKTYSIHESMLT